MDRKSLTFLSAVLVALGFGGSARAAATFDLAFDGCPPAPIEGTAGEVKQVELIATLTTAGNTTKDGPQGWSLSVAVGGGATVASITVKGVHISTRYDDDGDDPDEDGKNPDGDPATPIVDPFDLDLQGADFKVAQKAVGVAPLDPSLIGGVSAIVLRNTQKMVLQPNGKATVLKLTLNVTVPADPAVADVTVRFLDGMKGQGQPVNNVVTFGGASQKPATHDCSFQVREKVVRKEFNLSVLPETGAIEPALENGMGVVKLNLPLGPASVPCLVNLKTANLPGKDGPQGWSLSVAQSGLGTVGAVTVKGVHVSTRYDDDGDDPDEDGKNPDGDPATPIVDPFDLDLQGADFKVAQKATGDYTGSPIPGTNGVVSAIVLRNTQKMVLQPNASSNLLKVTYAVANVVEGANPDTTVTFLDALKGQGQAVNNVITFGGTSQKATSAQGLIIRITGVTGPKSGNFIRGDANNDAKVNIADAVYVVYAVVPTLASTGNYGVPCKDAADANNDSRVDLADAVYLIDWQFRGSHNPPAAPYPACGPGSATAESCPTGSTGCPAP